MPEPKQPFQSRNRETYDSNTTRSTKTSIGTSLSFQSRNRETYDSNLCAAVDFRLRSTRFNLVIEKLMIPTHRCGICGVS